MKFFKLPSFREIFKTNEDGTRYFVESDYGAPFITIVQGTIIGLVEKKFTVPLRVQDSGKEVGDIPTISTFYTEVLCAYDTKFIVKGSLDEIKALLEEQCK